MFRAEKIASTIVKSGSMNMHERNWSEAHIIANIDELSKSFRVIYSVLLIP